MLHSAPVAPIRGVFLSYSLDCLGCWSPPHRVLPQTIQSGGLGRAPHRPGLLSLAPCPVPQFVVCCARFPGSRHPVAVVAWHLSSCRGCGRRRASLACLVAPRWCAAPRPVRSLSVLRLAFPSLWCLPPPRRLSPPALLGDCAGHVEAGRKPGSCACCWPLPRQGRWARSASYPFGAPRWGCPWRVPPASVLGCVLCGGLACVDPVTDASGSPYRPSCDVGLGRCTGAVSCGRRHRPFRVGGHHARVPRVCACACPAWPGRACRPPGRVTVRLTFPLAVLGSLFARLAPFWLGLPCLWLLLVFFFFLFPFPPLVAPSLCPALRVFRPRVPWALASCPPPSFFLPPPPLPSGAFPAFRLPGASAPPPPFLSFVSCFSFFRFFFASCAVRGGFRCLLPSGVPACASVVLSLSLLCVRWLLLRGVRCLAWLSSAVSWWVLVSCFGGAVLVLPRGSPPCCSAWCVLVFRCPVLCSVSAVLSCGGVLSCSAVCLRRCLRPLFVSCRCASAVCVLGCRAVCSLSSPPCAVLCCAVLVPFRCAVRLVCAVSGGWCCWFLVSLPFAGGLLVALVARRCRLVVRVGLGARVWSCRRSASSLWCPAPLCCVLWRSAALWCCAVVPRLLFFSFFFSPCCWRWFPVVSCWFWAPGRFRVVSVSGLCPCGAVLVCLRRCSLFGALLPSRGRLVFCVVACCVCVCLAVLCCLLEGPCGSYCRVSVACWGVSLGAVLCRVAARCAAWRCVVVRCVVSFCSVWCCRALCCVLGRCLLSWGPVASGAVFCPVPSRCVCFAVACRCVVLFAVVLCAVCALGCRVVRFLSPPPCAVLLCGPLSLGALLPCAVPSGAVLPRGAVVSCPAALLGLFLAWVWLCLLGKPLQNFVIFFPPFFFGF